MSLPNVGLCNTCNARVPAEFVIRDGQVWIAKACPDHGPNESLVSGDAQAWQAKRDLGLYVQEAPQVCTLKCDTCRADHKPSMVFLDVTNHCNMHCPICIASIKRMGFDYNPPLDYFDKILAHVSQWQPKPVVQLFGGEPTCRDDLYEIIDLVRKHGLRPNVTTNGVRLADEEYCKKFCEARVGVRFAFDGFGREIYEKLRHNGPAYDKKLKGLENLKKYTRRKQAIISCIAPGINDGHVAELITYVHDNRDWISELLLIPLAETWDPKVFHEAPPSTLEGLETIVKQSLPAGGVEFVPAGLSYLLRTPRAFFSRNERSELLLLAGVHPNCESMTLMVSDGKQYRGINHFLKAPFAQVVTEFAELMRKVEPRIKNLDPTKPLQRLRGQWRIAKVMAPWVLRRVNIAAAMEGKPVRYLLRSLAESLGYRFRRKDRGEAAAHRRKRNTLRIALLPFEEQHSVDATRLENCKAVFPYEDEDGKIQTIPTCMWPPYRDVVLRGVAGRHGLAKAPRGAAPAGEASAG